MDDIISTVKPPCEKMGHGATKKSRDIKPGCYLVISGCSYHTDAQVFKFVISLVLICSKPGHHDGNYTSNTSGHDVLEV